MNDFLHGVGMSGIRAISNVIKDFRVKFVRDIGFFYEFGAEFKEVIWDKVYFGSLVKGYDWGAAVCVKDKAEAFILVSLEF